MAEEKKVKKTIVVDSNTCIGCGTCENIAPEYFKVKDDGISYVQKDYDEKDKDIIEEAIDSCPVQAISLK